MILGAIMIVFLLVRIAPGDPVSLLLGQGYTQQSADALRTSLGLNESLPVQLFKFIANTARGDMGTSITYGRPALGLVVQAFPATALLGGTSFLLSMAVALPAGVIGAYRRGSTLDRITVAVVLFSQAIPTFWFGIMAILVFAVTLRWLPSSGSGGLEHLILPAVTLSTFQVALLTRIVRSGLLEELHQDYVRTARAKGLSELQTVTRHVLHNTIIPIVTILALQLGNILAGAVVVEAVFAWPGIGSLAINAIEARDYPLVQAVVIFASVLIVTLTFMSDVAYAALDPRVRAR